MNAGLICCHLGRDSEVQKPGRTKITRISDLIGCDFLLITIKVSTTLECIEVLIDYKMYGFQAGVWDVKQKSNY